MKSILKDLKSEDSAIRYKAIDKINDLNLTDKEALLIIDESVLKYPRAKYDWQSIPGILVAAATKKPSAKFLPAIKKNFGKMDANARDYALLFLTKLNSSDAVKLYTELVIAHKNELVGLSTGTLGESNQYFNILFPKLMEAMDNEHVAPEILLLLLRHLENKNEVTDDFSLYVPSIFILCDKLLKKIQHKQTTFKSMNDIWDDGDYMDYRRSSGIILDLFGYIKAQGVSERLKSYLLQKDNHLKMFAAISLLRRNEEVSNEEINEIAADSETRNSLYDRLTGLNKKELFPTAFKSQKAFAESDMVNWLIYPTELARKPDKIELMKVIAVNVKEDGLSEFYVYRFKSDHINWKDDGWMAGIAGYYKVTEKPSTQAHGYTFSSFEKWEGQTPEEHLGDISDIIEKWEKKK